MKHAMITFAMQAKNVFSPLPVFIAFVVQFCRFMSEPETGRSRIPRSFGLETQAV